ncbi:MAG: GNAT family N-acetyltransferase [Clostridia bacterium]|nr:GNAT family N-acetyltransferase [Clostridia bacterium]
MTIEKIRDSFRSREAYAVYASCMFQPTYEKFLAKADILLADGNVHIFACRNGSITGLLAVEVTEKSAVIRGIAVLETHRRHGIGSSLIRHAMDELALAGITAETDDDAVGFYEHFGFTVTVCEEIYNDVPCRRYFCEYSC